MNELNEGSPLLSLAIVVVGLLLAFFVVRMFLRRIGIIIALGVGVGAGIMFGPRFTDTVAPYVPADAGFSADLVAKVAVGIVAFIVMGMILNRCLSSSRPSED